jgi:superfamily II DNA or RNA helicase
MDDIAADYGHIIVDEYTRPGKQLRKCSSAVHGVRLGYLPRSRKDGHQPIIFMQCGPVRHHVSATQTSEESHFRHVITRRTSFRYDSPDPKDKPAITDIYAKMVQDTERNQMIFDDVLRSLEKGRSPIVITERREHLEWFAERLSKFAKNVIVMKGGMGIRPRKLIAEKLAAIPDHEERLILATGRYLGEGFDDSRLDTLFLTMPIAWRGTLAQYAGRLHRLHYNKTEVIIYEYVDLEIPVMQRMYEKRLRGYRALGYVLRDEANNG